MKYGFKYGITAVIVTGVCHSAVIAQTTLNVDSGDWLSQRDLEAGVFEGQPFTLGTDLTIEVNDQGHVEDVGESHTGTSFSFAGSSVNVNDGGAFGQLETLISDIELTIFSGGQANVESIHGTGTVNVLGGELNELQEVGIGVAFVMSSGRLNTHYRNGLTGGSVTVTGGVLGHRFTVGSGGILSVSGGQIDVGFQALAGSDVTFRGGEFQFNGSAVSHFDDGFNYQFKQNEVFTGTLADGSVFILGDQAFDTINAGSVTLTPAPLAPVDSTPRVVSSGTVFGGLRSGQVMTLVDGGTLENHFAVVGATLNIDGGTVGDNLEAAYSTVNITGGQIGTQKPHRGDPVTLYDGSVVNITGGHFKNQLQPLAGSTVDVSGGLFEYGMRVRSESDTILHGDDFKLNGQPISELDAGLPENGVFTGTLADGTVFVFSNQGVATSVSNSSQFEADATTLAPVSLGPVDTSPQIISTGSGPQGLRPGQTLTLTGDGALGDNFAAVGSTLNIMGGTVGDFARIAYSNVEMSGGRIDGSMSVYGGTVNITGGEVVQMLEAFSGARIVVSDGTAGYLTAYDGGELLVEGGTIGRVGVSFGGVAIVRGGVIATGGVNNGEMSVEGGVISKGFSVTDGTLNITGGEIGDRLRTSSDGIINLSGGTVGSGFTAGNGSTINISGGLVGTGFVAGFNSTVNISDGSFGQGFTAGSGSLVNLFVLELHLDGLPVGLVEGMPFTVTDRDGILLTAILADGSSFDLTLDQNNILGQDCIDADATLTATLVPEPAAFCLFAGSGVLLARRRCG